MSQPLGDEGVTAQGPGSLPASAVAAAVVHDEPDRADGPEVPVNGAAADRAAVNGSGAGKAVVESTADTGAAHNGTAAVDRAAVNGSAAVDRAAVNGTAVNGAAVNGAAVDGAAVTRATVTGDPGDASAVDGATVTGTSAGSRAAREETTASAATPQARTSGVAPSSTPAIPSGPAARHANGGHGPVLGDADDVGGGGVIRTLRRLSPAGRRTGSPKAVATPPPPRTPVSAAIGAATEVVIVVAMALALALVIKTFLVQAFYIPSQSMENTLLVGDRVLVSKLTPGPFSLHRGDVVVFKDPGGWLPPPVAVDENAVQSAVRDTLTFVGLLPQDSGEHLIKRVIGLPGDHVQCDGRGKIVVNGVAIDEPYIYPGNQPSTKSFDVVVPAGHLWVMGDHRELSEDSRYHATLDKGTVPVDDVVGKAFVVVWPLARIAGIDSDEDAFARVPAPAGGS